MPHKDTLVIVPIYNEGENLEFVIKDLRKYFDNILVIDNRWFAVIYINR